MGLVSCRRIGWLRLLDISFWASRRGQNQNLGVSVLGNYASLRRRADSRPLVGHSQGINVGLLYLLSGQIRLAADQLRNQQKSGVNSLHGRNRDPYLTLPTHKHACRTCGCPLGKASRYTSKLQMSLSPEH